MNKNQIIPCIIDTNNEIIPIWDNRITYKKYKVYIDNGYGFHEFKNCIYNIETKQLSLGIELDYYDRSKIFKIGSPVLYETDVLNRKIKRSVITDIIYEDFDNYIRKGCKIEQHFLMCFNDVIIEPTSFYIIKLWKPTFVLSDGTKVNYAHQLYTLEE